MTPRSAVVVVQLSSSAGLLSRWIRWQTRSEFSHVDVVVPRETLDRYLPAELDPRAFSRRHPIRRGDPFVLVGAIAEGFVVHAPWKYRAARRYRVEMTEKQCDAYYRFMVRQLGKPYWWAGIVDWMLRAGEWRQDDRWFCSDEVARNFEIAGRPLLNRAVPCPRITPGNLEMSPLLRPVVTGTTTSWEE